MNIGFGSLSAAPRQTCMQGQKAAQPAFSRQLEEMPEEDFYADVFDKNLDTVRDRDTVINNEDIISLKIDLETMPPNDLYRKYFSLDKKNNKKW